MEREVGGEVSIVNGREGPWVVTKVSRPLEDPWWSDGNPPLRRVPGSTRPERRMAGNLKSPSLHPMNPKWGEGPRFNSTERWVMRRSRTRRGTATVEKRRSRARWGTETVQKSPMGRRPCVVRTLGGRVPHPRCEEVN